MKKLILLLALALPGWGAITYNASGDVTADGTGSSVSSLTTGTASHTTGRLLFVVISLNSTTATISSVTDTASNTYTFIARVSAISGQRREVWYAKNITGNASNAITANFSTSLNFGSVRGYEFAGLDTTSPLDVNGTGSSGSGFTVTSATFSTSQADELILHVARIDASRTWTANTGYTLMQGSSGQDNIQYKIESAQQTSVTVGMGISGFQGWASVIVSFKGAAAASSPARRIIVQ